MTNGPCHLAVCIQTLNCDSLAITSTCLWILLYFWSLNFVCFVFVRLESFKKLTLVSHDLFADRFTMPLGMEDRRILLGHLRASSSYNYNHGPDRARLNMYASHGRTGAWVARYRNTRQWLQIDLRQLSIVKGIATQGRREAHQWVKTFQLSYSRYGARFRSYVSHGRVKVKPELLWPFTPSVLFNSFNLNGHT